MLLVVDAHPDELATTATALARRFSPGHRIATAPPPPPDWRPSAV